MLGCCRTLESDLRDWSDLYAGIIRVVHLLSKTIDQLVDADAALNRTIAVLRANGHRATTPAAAFFGSRLTQMSANINRLVEQLREYRYSCRDVSTWVALAQAHTDTLGQYIVELLEERLVDEDLDAIRQLCQALNHVFLQVGELSEQNAAYAAVLVDELDHAHGLIVGHQDIANQSAGQVIGAESTGEINGELVTVERTLGQLSELSRDVAAISTPLDTQTGTSQVTRLLELMDQLVV